MRKEKHEQFILSGYKVTFCQAMTHVVTPQWEAPEAFSDSMLADICSNALDSLLALGQHGSKEFPDVNHVLTHF